MTDKTIAAVEEADMIVNFFESIDNMGETPELTAVKMAAKRLRGRMRTVDTMTRDVYDPSLIVMNVREVLEK